MKTFLDIIHYYTKFYANNQNVTQRDVQEIVAFVFNVDRSNLYLKADMDIIPEDLDKIQSFLADKATGKPLAYVLGFVEFYGCKICVDERVLIPRVETEILLDKILNKIKGRFVSCVYDLCCGSGCLGIGLKKQKPECSVYLADISKQALEVAQYNALANHVEVNCVLGDFLDAFHQVPKADLIVCNPPYIAEEDFEGLEKSVKDFEPKLALTAKMKGLEFFKKLSCHLHRYVNAGALVALEIGFNQKESVIEMFSTSVWKRIWCEQDYAGLDRFIFLEIE
ncbi:MAG: peptide chain release factor N(5)-glutamine methyltransferase [Chlamydiota bacterium]